MDFLYYSLLLLFIVLASFMTLLVLIQKGRGGGLSAAFGGVGGNTAFGAKTGDVLTWATSIIFGVFLLLAIALNLIANRQHAIHKQELIPVAAPTTVPTDAAASVVDKSPINLPATATTQPQSATPPVNPTPKPPPTPTTNPSTNPTASEVTATHAIAPAATQPVK